MGVVDLDLGNNISVTIIATGFAMKTKEFS